jgi:hypothetical protein
MTRVLRSYSTQDAAKRDLEQRVSRDQLTALSQALNDAFGSAGKNSGNHDVEGHGMTHIFHASAGKQGTDKTVTLFYFLDNGTLRLIALAKHETNGYRIDDELGQSQPPFEKRRLVGATGN